MNNIRVILSGFIVLMGIDHVRLRPTKPVVAFAYQSQDKPIMDPDHGSGRSFEQDRPRLDRFAKQMKQNASAEAYIIAFAGLVSYKNEARIRLGCIREYLIKTHGLLPRD